jgi:hypothetical protein
MSDTTFKEDQPRTSLAAFGKNWHSDYIENVKRRKVKWTAKR